MSYEEIELSRIRPSPLNPRKNWGGPKDDELVASVKSKGVLQPIVVRPMHFSKDAHYEIVAGERRWKAASTVAKENGGLAGATIPAMVRELTDDEAFDVMTIENLQREDLSELEEAEGFKAYLDRKGGEALPDLAGRTGIDSRYIRRRIRILTLPKEILDAWEKGKLAYGHLEQLLRLPGEEERKEFFRRALRESVEDIKRDIDRLSIPLGRAQFKTSEAGCAKCPSNSAVQNDLFGTDAGKARCSNPECFTEKSVSWLEQNWENSGVKKKFGTNGFRIYDYHKGINYRGFYEWDRPVKECKTCKDFVTLLRPENMTDALEGQACLNPACYQTKKGKKRAGDRKPAELAERRTSEHGIRFREEFFQTRIPLAFSHIPDLDPRVDALALLSLLSSNKRIHGWFAQSLPPGEQRSAGIEEDEDLEYFNFDEEQLARIIRRLPVQFIRELLRHGSLEVVMQREFGHDGRYRVATWLGADLQKEWTINQDYLMAKTKAEILALGDRLGITSDPKALAFLYEKLGKKRQRFDSCKKGELIRVFLESGIDLAEKVPEEILVKEQKCRVCGCTDDHACPGGCYWVKEDLCSACEAKQKADKKKVKKTAK